ncbi:hypothetical protein GMD78_05360 [Ornithinibacillus sp. L9]|uniref:Uncharacterized protein n=1 Tax=Ornithinibacillus caprae TaxID=2678566 RepID=A0A6N8FIG2_9BACI|nr:hypothetical protein [Ornithinibacillus caprae]MUK87827.1 hypothetical protein [Ornithinibacillus caprae]
MNRILCSVVIIICLIVINGCSGAKENEKFKISDGDPVVMTHDIEDGMEEKLKGVLEYDNETKCLYIKSTIKDDLNKIKVPIWPKGTTAYTENDLHGVKIPDHGTVLEGDTVEGGGGGVDASTLESDCLEKGITFGVTSFNK